MSHTVGCYPNDTNTGVVYECDDCGWTAEVLDAGTEADLESVLDQVMEHQAGVG